jgi:carbon storage regulator CsrA
MLVLSTRLHDRVLLPDAQTSIEVVEIQSSNVRLGITAPDHMRILREGLPDRQAEWGPPTEVEEMPTLPAIKRLLDKRLEIARAGLTEAREQLRAGNEDDARLILEKVDEDLFLLRRRLRRELEKADVLTCGV